MFKAAVHDGSQQLWLQQEVSEAGAVDGHVGALDVLLGGPISGRRLHCWLVLLIVIVKNNIVFGHLCKLVLKLEH